MPSLSPPQSLASAQKINSRTGGLNGDRSQSDTVASVEGELADKPLALKNAALKQTAENLTLGQVQKGAAATAMQSAATQHDSVNEIVAERGGNVAASDLPGLRLIVESIGRQVLGQYSQQAPLEAGPLVPENKNRPSGDGDSTVGGPNHDWRSPGSHSSDGRRRACGRENEVGRCFIGGASSKLPSDKPAMHADAEGVTAAEMRNDPFLTAHPVGVATNSGSGGQINTSNNNRNDKDKAPGTESP
ncbi:uncharacterized protein J3R85_020418 [Psidium guajava]|nr:uncharacterized protein J3R85_020418 [Psidium guajava]